jgi:hypothetical protein
MNKEVKNTSSEVTTAKNKDSLLGSFRTMEEMNLGVPNMRVLEKYIPLLRR